MVALSVFLKNQIVIAFFLFWEIVWKGLALWKSAKKGQKYWFIALLIVNSLGLLPIVYLLIDKYSKKSKD